MDMPKKHIVWEQLAALTVCKRKIRRRRVWGIYPFDTILYYKDSDILRLLDDGALCKSCYRIWDRYMFAD